MRTFSSASHRFSQALLTASIIAGASLAAHAGEQMTAKSTAPVEPVEVPYEAGRGLVTLAGPSGMFLNPTSATLPKGSFTMQYCLLFPNQDTDVVAHGLMAAYGITDWLEIGAVGNLLDLNAGVDNEFAVGGPIIRVRLLRDQSWWPQLSVGAYSKWGSTLFNEASIFAAAYKRVPISETGFFRSVGFHAGVRNTWFDEELPQHSSAIGYVGAEIQLPYRIYLVGEMNTRSKTPMDTLPEHGPYAWGVQWRLRGVNLSVAAMDQDGQGRVGIWSGFAFNSGF